MEKINIAELLKDCPQGMELDCTMYDGLEFDSIDESMSHRPVKCRIKCRDGGYNIHRFSKYGLHDDTPHSKCVIFPKGKTTWEGFVSPCKFKDGDIVYVTSNEKNEYLITIKANGYKWDTETETLEKLVEPKFKVGDKIKLKGGDEFGFITDVADCFYTIKYKNNTYCWSIKKQDDWVLVSDKFDNSKFIPFETRVLVRSGSCELWKPAIFGCCVEGAHKPYYALGGTWWKQCIPYKGNEHLLGKTDDCDD